MNTFDCYASAGLAVAVGFLIGLQREQSAAPGENAERRAVFGGIRTYPLVALVGALCALLVPALGAWIIGLGLAAVMGPILLAYADDLRHDRDRGITSEVAAIATFLLGAVSCSPAFVSVLGPRLLLVASLGVAVTVLLSLKEPLHAFAAKVSQEDLFATLKFAVLVIIALPLLPDRGYGPYGALNPFSTGMMIVLIAGISFIGYVAIRLLGPGRGLGLTGLLGGLVSSTAVTLSFSGRARKEPAIAGPCTLAVILASTVMSVRVLVEVAVVNRHLVPTLAWPIGAVAVAGGLGALIVHRRRTLDGDAAPDVKLQNPFELGPAVKFGLLYALILLAARAAREELGVRGLYLASLVAGTTDVDAITLTVAGMAKEGLPPADASTAILLAVGSNTLVKAGMAVVVGGWAFGRRIAAIFAFMLATGAAALAVIRI